MCHCQQHQRSLRNGLICFFSVLNPFFAGLRKNRWWRLCLWHMLTILVKKWELSLAMMSEQGRCVNGAVLRRSKMATTSAGLLPLADMARAIRDCGATGCRHSKVQMIFVRRWTAVILMWRRLLNERSALAKSSSSQTHKIPEKGMQHLQNVKLPKPFFAHWNSAAQSKCECCKTYDENQKHSYYEQPRQSHMHSGVHA